MLTTAGRLLAALAILVTGCAGSDGGSASTVGPASADAATSAAPTSPAPTAAPTTTPTTQPTTPPTTPPTTVAPVPPERLAGSMVLCSFAEPAVPAWVLERVQAGLAAGVLLYRRNLPSEMQAVGNAAAVQAAAQASPSPMPAIVATDQEGGIVARIPGPPSDSAAGMGLLPPPAIEAEGRATADLLRRWGVNTDLAPVADVARPDTFEARSRRSFGGDPAVVSGAVSAFVSGLRAGAVAATLKHFPGLGAASANTDHAEGAVTLSAEELRGIDLAPFRSGVAAGAELVMVSSATYPALAPGVAVTSPAIVEGVLRGELGFRGVAVSDALDASGLTVAGGPAEVAVAAAVAGVDLLITEGPGRCLELHQALVQAIADGRLPVERARQAAERVTALRQALAPVPPP